MPYDVKELPPATDKPDTAALTPDALEASDFNLTQANDPPNVCLIPSMPPALKISSGAKREPSWLPYST
jgi:hypothetical protein